jgi:hypothetical protein
MVPASRSGHKNGTGRTITLLGASPAEGALHQASVATPVPLYVGWVTSAPAGNELLGAAV